MPFTDPDEKSENQFEEESSGKVADEFENSLPLSSVSPAFTRGSDENYQTDEDFSEGSFSDSIKRLKHISIAKSHRSSNYKKNAKTHLCRFNVSLRNVKPSRHFRAKADARKCIKRKTIKTSSEHKKCLENPIEATKKGKRCLLGGKAKEKPPEEEHHDKSESDDDNDNYYFSRISLGYFQKFRDKSGASTSYQWPEDYVNQYQCPAQEISDKPSEEMELLELQRWGMTDLIYGRDAEALDKVDKMHPDSI